MKYLLATLLVLSAQLAEQKRSEDLMSIDEIYDDVLSQNPEITNQLIELDESLAKCGRHRIDIRELTIAQIREHFQMGRLSSVELTQCYLDRISQIDVYLRSVIEVNPEAITLARQADADRIAGLNDNPLHGIPILLKDNIGTADLMQTTAGALALEDLRPKRDAEVVRRLRRSSAIILGKASLTEWAEGGIPNGWNGRRGQTVNAYVLNQNPSGSSSGSAVAVSVNVAAISLGSETDGSIISPSSKNAIVGLKPTFGAVSTEGVIPLAFSNDVVGPMVRSVEDAGKVMAVISDIDLQGCDLDIAACLEDRDFKIGVLREPFWNLLDPSVAEVMPELEKCLQNLDGTGLAEVVDPLTAPFMYSIEKENIILLHEFKHSINNYLMNDVVYSNKERNRTIYSLADIIRFNEKHPPAEDYDQEVLILSETTDGLRNKTYISSLHEYQRGSVRYLDSIFDETSVDALATPCASYTTPLLYSYGAAAGYPSISVPVGVKSNGVPFGLCLLGRPFSEATLLKLGSFIEQSRPNGRPVPRFISQEVPRNSRKKIIIGSVIAVGIVVVVAISFIFYKKRQR